MGSRFSLRASRVPRIMAIALLATVATCVEDRTPTSSEALIVDSLPAAEVASGVTQALLAVGTNTANQKIYTTASIAPGANALITVAVLGHNSSSAPPSPTLTGGGMTDWSEVATVVFDGATPLKRLTIFRAMSPSPGSGPLTITWSATVSNCQWIVSQWDGVDASGVNGAGAIVQTGSTRGDGVDGLTVALAPFADVNNVAYGVFGLRTNAISATPGAGFTEIAEQPSGEGTPSDLQAEWAVNDNSIDATWSSLNAAALGVEIRAGTGGGGGGGGGGASASLSTVTAIPASVVAGATSTVTVTVKDANGDPLSGATVELAVSGSGNTVTQPTGLTDDAGVATGTVSSTVAEAKTVSAKANGTAITQTAALTVTSGAVAADQSTIAAAPSTIAPGGGSATITVTARDAFGNPISGAAVVLGATGAGGVLTQPTQPTDGNGVATGSLSGTVEETIIVSATVAGTPITPTATVEVATQSVATISHALLTVGTDPTNQKVYTTAPIAPAPNALVTVAVLGHRSSSAASSPALSGGGMPEWVEVASVTFDDGGRPHKRLTVYRAMSAAPGSGPLTITWDATESNCQWIVSQWQGVDVSGVSGSGAIGQSGAASGDGVNGLAVTLAPFGDANNVAYGVFGIASAAADVASGTGFTEIAEQPSGERTSGDLAAQWAAGLNTLDATWPSLNGAALGIEIKAGVTGPQDPVATVEISPATATVLVGATLQLVANLLNVGGEPLTGRPVTWSSDAPQFATVSSTGLVTGVAAGPATISATSEGVVGTASVTVSATVEPVATVEVTPGAAGILVGGTVQLTATPKDAAGQPLTGRVIVWESDATQIATVSTTGLVTGVGEGLATITATSEGQSGQAIVTVTTGGTAALVGQWSAVMASPIVQVHLHLLYDGRVLSFGGSSATPQVWDPATGLFTAVPVGSLVFCSGHTWLPDGRLLVTGGGTGNGRGYPNTDIFDPATTSWVSGPTMTYARWYPTNTTMPNGDVLTVAGQDENGTTVPIPELWEGTGWRELTGASLALSNYPRNFVAPDGRIFEAGPQRQSHWLDVSGTGTWTNGPSMNFGSRSYGSAVMYEVGKILYAGGNSTPTSTAEIIDLNQPNPAWTYTGSLAYARWNLNATVLPDGQVLVTGGVSGDRSNPQLAVNAAEMWNPATGLWTTMASSAQLLRGYHSTSLLLPDGRILHSGGGDGGGTPDNLSYQIYSPPYLFRGARPTVTGVTPSAVTYGQVLTVETPDAIGIVKVTLIRNGSVTHAFDQAQLLVNLTFSQVSGGLTVSLPTSRTAAPPGPYMLFLVNANGVPSVARLMILN